MPAPTHITEDLLELYALRRVSDAEVAPIEEHLLICSECQDRLASIDQFISALRSASSSTRSKHAGDF